MPTSQEDNTNAGQPGADAAVEVEAEESEAVEEVSGEETPEADTEKGEIAGLNTKGLDTLDGESLRRMVRDLRRESGNYRTQLQKVRDAQVKSEEEFSTLQAELAKRDRELVRERVGAQFDLPPALRSRLQGDTEEEILADAKEVAGLFKPASSGFDSTNPSGGLDSHAPPAPSPEDLAAKIRAQRY